MACGISDIIRIARIAFKAIFFFAWKSIKPLSLAKHMKEVHDVALADLEKMFSVLKDIPHSLTSQTPVTTKQ